MRCDSRGVGALKLENLQLGPDRVGMKHARLVAVLGLVISATLIGMFWHLRFYARGFDQDTWAPR